MRRAFDEPWITATAAGFAAVGEGKIERARLCWLRAASEASATASDALMAAARNNAGLACLFADHPVRAQEHFDTAIQLWTRTAAQAAVADFPIPGRSSAFHLRLAVKHHDAFTALQRQRYAQLCAAALAKSMWNTVLAAGALGGDRVAPADARVFASLLSDAFGPHCTDLIILRNALAAGAGECVVSQDIYGAYAAKVMPPADRHLSDAQAFSADVENGAHLTAIMHPGLLPRSAPRSQDYGGAPIDGRD
jgi:hypothetical protein